MGSARQPAAGTTTETRRRNGPSRRGAAHLVRSAEVESLLLVATYRDSPLDMTAEVADVLAELLRVPGVERMRLPGLEEAGVGALMAAQAGHQLDEQGRALARMLHSETAGNPFFIRELLRHLTEKGTLVRRDGRWTAALPVSEVDVPDSVWEVIGRRLTRLPERTGEVLATAAVLGEHFDLALLVESRRETPADVVAALTPAVTARLVEEVAVGDYRFSHALVRSTLVRALGPTRRAQLHLCAAEALESAPPGRITGRAAVLAAHYQQAGSLAPAQRVIEALIEAGNEAAAALAWEQGAAHWQGALDLMNRVCPGGRQQAELLARLADLLHVTGFDLTASITHAERAIELFDRLGLQQRAAVLRSRLAGYLSSNSVVEVMDIPRALELFSQAERVLRADPESLAYGYLLGTLSTATGLFAARPDQALATALRAVEIARRHGHEPLGVLAQMVHGFALAALGSVEEGLALVEQAWQGADRLNHRILGMRTVHIRAFWAVALREPNVAITWTERELAKPRLAQTPIQRRFLQGQLAWGYGLTGRLSDAERLLTEAGGLPVGASYAPELKLWQGDWPGAEAALRHWTSRYREMGDRTNEALLHGWTAHVCRLRGDLTGAESCLHSALNIATPGHHRVVEAGLRIDLAVLELDRQRPERARHHVDRAKALMAGADWRGLTDRLALAEAALEADLPRAGALFERVVTALRARMLPWDEAEALLLWARAASVDEPSLARVKRTAAAQIYRCCNAGQAWLDRVEPG
ncbi:hypothetical protein [Pseudonocardia sp.]|uniref:ATP-binding protein n=1 Tax=Pseudonocardia sp. TaxID=60912 RepID=UPI002ED9499B